MKIRPFEARDASELARIFYLAVHEIAALHYNPDQIAAWAPRVPDAERFVDRGKDGRILLVAVDDRDVPIAYGDCEDDGHLDHLFCRPDRAGTGITAGLYGAIENAAKTRGIQSLHVEASEPARRFFTRQGFVTVARNDFDIAGVPMHNFRMTKRLD